MEQAHLCRDCCSLTLLPLRGPIRCPTCRSPRLTTHPELETLTIAHMDCDAFYASVEKRDNPEIRNQPVIIGGGKRGVVSTACYIARIKGVRSAMPMFQALKLCPEAVVVKPRMEAYVEVSRQIKSFMQDLTPEIEPLSLDEAFMDLTGTQRLHGASPAVMLARLIQRMETELGISGSIGLSHNKFLAKIASDLDKPRGFSVIGKAETEAFLEKQPVKIIWGVGKAFQQTLERDGIRKISDLKTRDRKDLAKKYGTMGDRLWHLSRGLDQRRVSSRAPMKSISNETTFFEDTSDPDLLDGHLWRLTEKVSARAKARDIAGRIVTLKLKRANFKSLTRRVSLNDPTQMASRIYNAASPMLAKEFGLGPFRLIGVGISNLSEAQTADLSPDLLDTRSETESEAERATDVIRQKFGADAIMKGRSLR